MAYQSGQNVLIAHKVESTFNTAPGASGGKRLRFVASPGMTLRRGIIESQEVRADQLASPVRLGMHEAQGSYGAEMSVGTFDELLEAVLRSTWVAAVAITQAAMTSITTTTSTIVAAAGSWIAQGVRVGDIVTLTGHATTANNDLRLRVTAVTASTITVAGTPLTADAVADTSFTLTILRKLKTVDGAPTKRSFYFEQYYQDLDLSEVFGGVIITGFTLRGTPNGMASIEFRTLGASGVALAEGASAYFSSPTLTTAMPLVFTDAKLRLGSEELVRCTGFELSCDLEASMPEVIGSTTAPAGFTNRMTTRGSLSFLKQDLAFLTALGSETEYELSVLLQENESAPKDCHSFFVPALKLTANDHPLGGAGAMLDTCPFVAYKKEGVTGYDNAQVTMCSSAA